jgi:hypothetical protein
MRRLHWITLAMLALLAPSAVNASWPVLGRRVSDNDISLQTHPRIVSDGQGGAFVAWNNETEDATNPSIKDVYIQHVTADGDLAPGWPPIGIPLELRGDDQQIEAMSPDGVGGVIVTWQDFGTGSTASDVFAQRIGPDGQRPAGWPPDGLPVCAAPGPQGNSCIVPDGLGGALITWLDYRYQQYLGEPFGVRVLADGTVAPGWPVNGRRLQGDGNSSGCTTFSDGFGGAILVTGAPDGERALRMDLDGNTAPGWGPDGVVAIPAAVNHSAYNGYEIGDGTGGTYLFWADWRSMPPPFDPYTFFDYLDIYGVHVRGDGTMDPGWPTTGLPVAVLGAQQDTPQALADGSGGVFVMWQDSRAYFSGTAVDIYGTHLNGDGTPGAGWPANGLPVIVGPGSDALETVTPAPSRLALDGSGGLWVCSYDEFGGQRSRVQHIHADGTRAAGFPLAGQEVPPAPYGGQQDMVITGDGFGNALVAWRYDWAYVQRVGDNIVTATTMALLSSQSLPDHVVLTWQGSGPSQVSVERRTGAGPWIELARLSMDREGIVRYEDAAVEPGTSYGYRLSYVDGATTEHTTETTVLVPRAYTLALSGFRPNPASSADMAISFELPSTAPGRLELLDVTGRRLAERDLSSYGAGRYTEHMTQGAHVSPGMYWIRLTHAGKALTARGAVLR